MTSSQTSDNNSSDSKQLGTRKRDSNQLAVPMPLKKMKPVEDKEVDKLELAVLQLVETECTEKNDADRQYCLSLIPILKRMTPCQKLMLHVSIEQAILDIENPVPSHYHHVPPNITSIHCHQHLFKHSATSVVTPQSREGEGTSHSKSLTPLMPVPFESMQY